MSDSKVYRAIGLMSGTSLDGIDIALIETDGENHVKPIFFETSLYTRGEKDIIRAALGKNKRDMSTELAEKTVTDKHIFVLRNFINNHDLVGKIDLIGFHGQTIFHDPENAFTWQIGDGAALAHALGIPVVNDFRKADMESGGQGAPLLPLYHRAFAAKLPKPVAIINIGGVSNITWLGKDKIMAFDCGAGNALMDDLVLRRTGQAYDRDGALARKGKVHEDLVKEWMRHPYFNQAPPKSLDRDAWDVSGVSTMSTEDGLATLCDFTVQSLRASLKHCPKMPKICYVTGGGRLNKFLMERLGEAFGCIVEPVESVGGRGDSMEAEGFAYLAVRSLCGLPITEPETTGVSAPCKGGILHTP